MMPIRSSSCTEIFKSARISGGRTGARDGGCALFHEPCVRDLDLAKHGPTEKRKFPSENHPFKNA
jgi:hypothetical protein